VAPVIVDPEKDEVYFTPIFYTLSHFSRFIRPNAVRIGVRNSDKDLLITAAKNVDGTIAVVVFNEGKVKKNMKLIIDSKSVAISISEQAIQTIIIQ